MPVSRVATATLLLLLVAPLGGCAALLASDRPAEKDPAFARCPIGTSAVVDRLAAAFGSERFDTSRVVLQVSPALDADREIETFRRRLDLLGGGTRSYTQVGSRAELVIELPAGARLAHLLRPGRLGVHEVDEDATRELHEGAHPDDITEAGRIVALDPSAGTADQPPIELALHAAAIGSDAVASCGARVIEGDMGPYLRLELTEAGGKALLELTTRTVGRRVAITVDGLVTTAPTVMEPISGGRVQIGGGADTAWRTLAVQVALLNAPALSAPLTLVEQTLIPREE